MLSSGYVIKIPAPERVKEKAEVSLTIGVAISLIKDCEPWPKS